MRLSGYFLSNLRDFVTGLCHFEVFGSCYFEVIYDSFRSILHVITYRSFISLIILILSRSAVSYLSSVTHFKSASVFLGKILEVHLAILPLLFSDCFMSLWVIYIYFLGEFSFFLLFMIHYFLFCLFL